jgi:hypothetical protein
VAPGTSPFRGIGAIYRGLIEFAEGNVKGGMERVLEEVRDPALARYLGQRFAFSSWYDVLPMPYLGAAVARARGVSFEQQIVDSNRWSEERVGSIYRALLALMSTERVATTLPKAAAIVHDFGRVTCQAAGPQRITGVRRGIPGLLVRWLALSHGAYLDLALRRAGASTVRVQFGPPVRDGENAGIALYQIPFEIQWT